MIVSKEQIRILNPERTPMCAYDKAFYFLLGIIRQQGNNRVRKSCSDFSSKRLSFCQKHMYTKFLTIFRLFKPQKTFFSDLEFDQTFKFKLKF